METRCFNIKKREESPLKKCIIAALGSVHRLVHPTKAHRIFICDEHIYMDSQPAELIGCIKIVGFDGLNFLVQAGKKSGICGKALESMGIKFKFLPAPAIYSVCALDFCEGVAAGVRKIDSPFAGEDFI